MEAAAARAWSGARDIEFYPTLWLKAAVLLHGLATTQHFSDGSKRTAWVSAVTFLRLNGEDLVAIDPAEGEQMVLAVVARTMDADQIAGWLLGHTAPPRRPWGVG